MNTQPAFDLDFDSILGELDLDLAGDLTTHLVQKLLPEHNPTQDHTGLEADVLKELFGVHPFPIPEQQAQPNVEQQVAQEEHRQVAQQAPVSLPPQQHMTLQQQEIQSETGTSTVHQLPGPFMQPLPIVTPGLAMQGAGEHTAPTHQHSGDWPALWYAMQAQQQVSAASVQDSFLTAPLFTFNTVPMPAWLQQSMAAPMPAINADSAASGPALLSLPSTWPQYVQEGGAAAVPQTPRTGIRPGGHTSIDPLPAAFQGHGRRTGAAPPAVPAASPAAKKAKAPSQRFRERQRATISSLEAEVTQKLAELQVLSEENQTLKLRTRVLEAVTEGGEIYINVMKEHGPPTYDITDDIPRSSSGTEPLSRNTSSISCLSGSSQSAAAAHDSSRTSSLSAGGGTADADAGAAAATAPVNALGPAVTAATDDGVPVPNAAAARAASDAAAADDSWQSCASDLLSCRTSGRCSTEQQQRSVRTIRHMSVAEVVTHWRQFLQEVSEPLLMLSEETAEQPQLSGAQLGPGASSSVQTQGKQQPPGRQLSTGSSLAVPVSRVSSGGSCSTTLDAHHATVVGGSSTAGRQGQAHGVQHEVAAAGGAGSAAPSAPSSGAAQRIQELVSKYCNLTKVVGLLNPAVAYAMYGRSLDTGEAVAYTDEHWRNVVAHLELTEQQLTHILAAADVYFSRLRRVLEDRAAIYEALAKADNAPTSPLLSCHSTAAADQLSLLDMLSRSMRLEHVLRVMISCTIWGRTLTPVQLAKMAVYSHPFFPDVHAMVCVLYEDHRRH